MDLGLHPGQWAWSLEHRQACRIVEAQDLWGEAVYRVWVPGKDAVVRLRASQLRAAGDGAPGTAAWTAYVAAAGRVADALTQDVLVAPLEASVIPLPHQIRALSRVIGSEERGRVQEAFAAGARILVSTEAGGEGLNLQFCHVVVNYDIPWNPMRLEQRIGRVDRIGQEHPVRAVNFVIRDTVEHRVREVLEEKLAVILEEFGADKAGDILDSALAGQMFDDLYAEAILRPDALGAKVDSVLEQVREQGRAVRDSSSVLGSVEDLDPREARSLLTHPLPHWVERMTVSYILAQGGAAERIGSAWHLTWPDGKRTGPVVFTLRDLQREPSAKQLTLEDRRVRELAERIPWFAPDQPVPCLTLRGLPEEVRGSWSLWRISAHTASGSRHRVMPIFLHEDGRTLAPTARFVWDQLLGEPAPVERHLEGDACREVFEQVEAAAREQGRQIYQELVQSQRTRIAREREKGEYAFSARRRAIERIGLPAVRDHRLAQLTAEEKARREQLDRKAQTSPELVPLLLLRVEGRGGDG